MSKKSAKIERLISGLSHPVHDPHYLGFFVCFNQQDYYEAHDVLEELWLEEGRNGSNYHFYKGLIQTAGAFVHLQKHWHAPNHHVHGKRLEPGGRLFGLALANLERYPQIHQGIDLQEVRTLNQDYIRQLATSSKLNPWSSDHAPRLTLPL